jgi:hypothetical protein
MTAWNDFVKKIYHEGHKSNPNYQFKQALKDASKRKGEMGSSSSASSGKSYRKKSKKSCMKSCKRSCSKGRRMKGGMNNTSGNLEGSELEGMRDTVDSHTSTAAKPMKGGLSPSSTPPTPSMSPSTPSPMSFKTGGRKSRKRSKSHRKR